MADILVLTADFPPNIGGVSSDTFAFCEMLRMRHNVHVYAFGVEGAGTFGAESVMLNKIQWKSKINELCSLRSYDLIVIKTVRPLGMMIGRQKGAVQAFYVHGSELRTKVLHILSPDILLEFADVVIANSHFTALQTKKNCSVFPPCIMPLQCKAGKQVNDPFSIGCIGRLVKHKNFISMTRIIRKINDLIAPSGKRAVCTIAGSGPEYENILKCIEESGMQDSIKLAGNISQDEKRIMLSSIDMLASVSIDTGTDVEGFGMTVQEAGVCRVPALAYDSGGLRESVEIDELLIAEGNEDAFAAKAAELAIDEGFYGRMADLSMKRSMQYVISEKRLDEFERIVGIGSGGRI